MPFKSFVPPDIWSPGPDYRLQDPTPWLIPALQHRTGTGVEMDFYSSCVLRFEVLKFPTGHPSPPLGFPYSMSGAEHTTNQQVTQGAVKSVCHWAVQTHTAQTKGCFQKIPAMCHNTSAGSWLPGGKPLLPGPAERKTGPSKALCTSRVGAPFSTHQLCCFPFPLAALKREVKSSHLALGGRKEKQLSCGGKDTYYLLFKSGVTSGHRSMRKGNLKAERIWTLEISTQKWCLLVSCAVRGQTHPARPGRLQKGPFSVAEQREAGGPGGA